MVGPLAVRMQLVTGREPPGVIGLPWATPLADWPPDLLVRMAHGVSRHVVRFARAGDAVYALKEMPEPEAVREYGALRELLRAGLPAVEAVGLVTGREAAGGEPLDAVLVTRYLDYSLPYRYLFGVEAGAGLASRLVDAAVVLLARLHVDGFFWGDCSLSNLLFRRDAGALMAYLVDAETTERHSHVSDGLRAHELSIAVENVIGGLLDLQSAGRLAPEVDALGLAALLEERYDALWAELTGSQHIDASEQHEIESRIRRLNELGFDAGELVVERHAGGERLVVQPALVEEGHHAKELRRLTGLEVQENQARRLLNDVAAFGAHLAHEAGRDVPTAVVAARWIAEVYEPVVAAVPAELSGRLEPAELFHELLEHRYYLAEQAGHEVDNLEALASYVDAVLRHRPEERVIVAGDE